MQTVVESIRTGERERRAAAEEILAAYGQVNDRE